MTRSMLLVLPVLALSATLAGARTVDVENHMNGSDARAVAEFTAAVDRYLALHLLLESPMSALTIDPEQATRARRAHRAAILAARSLDRRGDAFTPRVSTYLRRQIALAEEDTDVAILGRLPGLPKGIYTGSRTVTSRSLMSNSTWWWTFSKMRFCPTRPASRNQASLQSSAHRSRHRHVRSARATFTTNWRCAGAETTPRSTDGVRALSRGRKNPHHRLRLQALMPVRAHFKACCCGFLWQWICPLRAERRATMLSTCGTLDGFALESSRGEGLDIRTLDAGATLVVTTRRSSYRIVVLDGARQVVLIEGGVFPEATAVQGPRVRRLAAAR